MKYYIYSSGKFWKNNTVYKIENIESLSPRVFSMKKCSPLLFKIEKGMLICTKLNNLFNNRNYKLKIKEDK